MGHFYADNTQVYLSYDPNKFNEMFSLIKCLKYIGAQNFPHITEEKLKYLTLYGSDSSNTELTNIRGSYSHLILYCNFLTLEVLKCWGLCEPIGQHFEHTVESVIHTNFFVMHRKCWIGCRPLLYITHENDQLANARYCPKGPVSSQANIVS